MHTKMLELAEKIEEKAQRWQESACEKSVTGDGSRYAIPKHAVANALMDLAHDIRSIFTPRDWREGCVVEQKKDGNWDVESPCRSYYLGRCLSWGMYDNRGCRFRTVGSHTSESSARAALASCTTPYPGYKENTCDTPSVSSGVSPSTVAPTSTPAPSSPVAVVKGGAGVAGGSSNTLTFGGPALRVAFHFDGDRLVRWEILEQREELRGTSESVFTAHSSVIRSCCVPELNASYLYVRGSFRDGDETYRTYTTHTRASITTLGAEIDQVNREWCEKLGIGEKAHIDYPQKLEQAEAWEAVCRVADEVDENWHKLSMIGRDSICTLIRNLSRDRDNLRRQLDAAEKVMRSFNDLDVPWTLASKYRSAYRTTYPKTGGAA